MPEGQAAFPGAPACGFETDSSAELHDRAALSPSLSGEGGGLPAGPLRQLDMLVVAAHSPFLACQHVSQSLLPLA